MADATPNRLGQINQTGDELALFQKKFSGEVLSKYIPRVTMDGKHFVKGITQGKGYDFPAVGGISAHYHTPGAELTGQGVNHGNRYVPIDSLLISDIYVDNLDELMLHWDVRSRYAKQMAGTMAKKYDMNIMKEIILGARAGGLTDDMPGGTILKDANFGAADEVTRMKALVDGIYAAEQALYDNDVDVENEIVYCALKPADYAVLTKNADTNGWSPIHRDYGGEGSIATGKIPKISNIHLVRSNNLPTTNLTLKADANYDPYHTVNASTTSGIVWVEDAIGTVKLMEMTTEAGWDMRRQAWLILTKMAVGHGWLRPEGLVELRTGTPT